MLSRTEPTIELDTGAVDEWESKTVVVHRCAI